VGYAIFTKGFLGHVSKLTEKHRSSWSVKLSFRTAEVDSKTRWFAGTASRTTWRHFSLWAMNNTRFSKPMMSTLIECACAERYKEWPVRQLCVVHDRQYIRGGQPIRDQEPDFLLR